ncbi:Ger(x)C family spore germination protein [Bacillus timonensis]|nr:Ger(x)C family spore germination protein [Bacillus timonensis]
MKRRYSLILMIMIVVFPSGCNDRLELEDQAITLVIGIGKDQEGKLSIYQTNPVFNELAKIPMTRLNTIDSSLRDARQTFSSMNMGRVVGGKVQVILLEKEILEEENILPILDVFYRDPKNSVNCLLVAVDKPVSDFIYYDIEPTTQLGIYLKNILLSNIDLSQSIDSKLLTFHYQMFDKSITPSLATLSVTPQSIEVVGTTLLDEKGKFAYSLNRKETTLHLFLQDKIKNTVSFTIDNNDNLDKPISYSIDSVKRKVKTNFKDGLITFNININTVISLTEEFGKFDVEKDSKKIEKIIENQLKDDLTNLMKSYQSLKIDPVGLGAYFRAYHYEEFMKNQDNWGETFSNAVVNIRVKVKMKSFGIINKL